MPSCLTYTRCLPACLLLPPPPGVADRHGAAPVAACAQHRRRAAGVHSSAAHVPAGLRYGEHACWFVCVCGVCRCMCGALRCVSLSTHRLLACSAPHRPFSPHLTSPLPLLVASPHHSPSSSPHLTTPPPRLLLPPVDVSNATVVGLKGTPYHDNPTGIRGTDLEEAVRFDGGEVRCEGCVWD